METSQSNRTRDAVSDPEARRVFEEELLFGEARETLSGLLHSQQISQAELAKRLGVSKARISQILSGRENLTLRSLAAIGWALGFRFGLEPQAAERLGTPAVDDPPPPEWIERFSGQEKTYAPAARFDVADPDGEPLGEGGS